MAKFTFEIKVLTHFSYTLDRLQNAYPSCEIINQLISLFEVLKFHEQAFDKEPQEAIADSALGVLNNLLSLSESIESFLGTEAERFPEEDREKIKEVLNFDAEHLRRLLSTQGSKE